MAFRYRVTIAAQTIAIARSAPLAKRHSGARTRCTATRWIASLGRCRRGRGRPVRERLAVGGCYRNEQSPGLAALLRMADHGDLVARLQRCRLPARAAPKRTEPSSRYSRSPPAPLSLGTSSSIQECGLAHLNCFTVPDQRHVLGAIETFHGVVRVGRTGHPRPIAKVHRDQ